MATASSTPTTLNALSVLLSALPSDVASSLEQGYNTFTHELLATNTNQIQQPTKLPSIVSPAAVTSATAQTTEVQPANTEQPSSQTLVPTTFQTTMSSTSIRQSTTISTSPTGSTAVAAQSASPSPTPSPAQQRSTGTIAGIATGACAGAVLIVLALLWFLRRRHQHRESPSGGKVFRKQSKRVFPEVAWLYDPPREASSPAHPSQGRDAASEALLQGRTSNERAAPHSALGSHPNTTQKQQYADHRAEGARSVEPLLAPAPAATRDNSPAGSDRSRGNSPGTATASRHTVAAQAREPRMDVQLDQRPLAGMWDVPPGWAR